MPLQPFPYNREKAVEYAHRWAYSRNQAYSDFTKSGGDCTNFASQCVFAGAGVMNYTPTFGWFYRSIHSRTPSWSGVPFFYNFLVRNKGAGPFAVKTVVDQMQVGDIVQISFDGVQWQHSPVIVAIEGAPTVQNIYVAAHTYDADYKPLASYTYQLLRFVHIEGYRKYL